MTKCNIHLISTNEACCTTNYPIQKRWVRTSVRWCLLLNNIVLCMTGRPGNWTCISKSVFKMKCLSYSLPKSSCIVLGRREKTLTDTSKILKQITKQSSTDEAKSCPYKCVCIYICIYYKPKHCTYIYGKSFFSHN